MIHSDHVFLLEGEEGIRERFNIPIRGTGGVWADLGSGTGAFTLALADLLGPGAQIYSLDKDRRALDKQAKAMGRQYPQVKLIQQIADFTRPLDLPPLDGLVMANSLHYTPNQEKVNLITRLMACLKPGGQFTLVEYNANHGNTWVPYPVSYTTWTNLAEKAGFAQTVQIAALPSRFLGEIFSAVSTKA